MSTLPHESAHPDTRAAEDAARRPLPRLAGREHFIPFRKAELATALAETPGLAEADRAHVKRFCRLLDLLVHGQFHAVLEELKNAYAPFDPDADTRPGGGLPETERDRMRGELFDRFAWLLGRGNFVRLAKEEIHQSVTDRSHWGMSLNLNFEIFDRLDIYCRGDVIGTRYRRRWQNRFRSEAVEVPIYQRLVVVFRLRPDTERSKYFDTEDVYIKIFKDIPKLDLDMLLPGTQVKMSLFDRARILVPSLSGIAVGLAKLLLVAALSPILVLTVLGGTLGYSARTVYGYLNTRQKYQLNLTQSLYFQNLDNNAGAIHRLLDEAEEQENREAMLAYFFLWREAPADGFAPHELDQSIERFLHQRAGGHVDFEVSDALEKLQRLGVAKREPSGQWQAVPIERAIDALAQCWTKAPG